MLVNARFSAPEGNGKVKCRQYTVIGLRVSHQRKMRNNCQLSRIRHHRHHIFLLAKLVSNVFYTEFRMRDCSLNSSHAIYAYTVYRGISETLFSPLSTHPLLLFVVR
jgi:hypothetical protein